VQIGSAGSGISQEFVFFELIGSGKWSTPEGAMLERQQHAVSLTWLLVGR
jgi:hypothetical protein